MSYESLSVLMNNIQMTLQKCIFNSSRQSVWSGDGAFDDVDNKLCNRTLHLMMLDRIRMI